MPRSFAQAVASFGLELFWKLKPRSAYEPSPEPIQTIHTRSNDHAQRIVHLRTLLRRFPYWLEGHLRLATESLSSDDVATAYASAMCAIKLAQPDSRAAHEASFTIGLCYLKRGDPARALASFEALEHANHPQGRFPQGTPLEETAAALMALGRDAEALAKLDKIPLTSISPEAKAALEYLRAKLAT